MLAAHPLRFAAVLCLLTAGLLTAAGCSVTPQNVWVYVDNAGEEKLVVTVDGKPVATIPPGEFAKLEYPPGVYQFHVQRGNERLCDLPEKLEASDKLGRVRKYLFNPDKLNVYCSYEVKYGGSRLDGILGSTLLSFQKDEQVKNQYVYRQLLKEVKLVPTDAWNDVSEVEYVLTAPPESLMTRSGSSRRLTVLDRLERADYDRLTAAAKNDKPTDEDIDALDELLDEILSKAL